MEAAGPADCFERLAADTRERHARMCPAARCCARRASRSLSSTRPAVLSAPLTHLARRPYRRRHGAHRDQRRPLPDGDDGTRCSCGRKGGRLSVGPGTEGWGAAARPRGYPRGTATQSPLIDLNPTHTREERRRVRARPGKGSYADFREGIASPSAKLYPQTYWDVFSQNTMSLDLYCHTGRGRRHCHSRTTKLCYAPAALFLDSIPAVIPGG